MTLDQSADSSDTNQASALDELTSSVTKLAIAWREGDKESGEILFRNVLRFFRRKAESMASRFPDRTPTEVINEAYVYINKMHPTRFNDRHHFLATYMTAMNYWLKDYIRYLTAAKRSGFETTIKEHALPSQARNFSVLLIDLDGALDRLVSSGLVDEAQRELFLNNKIIGITHADLATIHEKPETGIRESINETRRLVSIEMAAYLEKSKRT